QIENGAPADVFISAAPKQMNALADKGLIVNDTRRDLLNNKVVLIVPQGSSLGIDDFNDLLGGDIKKIALGDPEFVPAGSYGKKALEQLGIWDELQPKMILCSDVRQVLSYVETTNVDAGIVYSTDAAISTSVKVVADGPDAINSSIIYPVAVVEYSKNLDAASDYINFLFSDEVQELFEKYGFAPIDN
ncbi:MAG: molybdate ABC transporter substrate-binding protein, partial [Dehalococcoidales bacterium]